MEFDFDPLEFTSLPPAKSEWKRATAFIAGMVANRLVFDLVNASAWIPPREGNRSDEVIRLKGRLEREFENCLTVFRRCLASIGYSPAPADGVERRFSQPIRRMETYIHHQDSEGGFELAEEARAVRDNGFGPEMEQLIGDAVACVRIDGQGLGSNDSNAAGEIVNAFELGMVCDFLVKTYAFRTGFSETNYSIALEGDRQRFRLPDRGRRHFSGFEIPGGLLGRALGAWSGHTLHSRVVCIQEWLNMPGLPSPGQYYQNIAKIWSELCRIDCENLSLGERVEIHDFNLKVDGCGYPSVRNDLNYKIFKMFFGRGNFNADSAVLGTAIPEALDQFYGDQSISSAGTIDPRDRLSKCKAKWARHFRYSSNSGNPERTEGVGYFLELIPPRAVLKGCQ